MINAPAAPITAEALIGVRIERLARYGEAGVGAVVAAEADCDPVHEVDSPDDDPKSCYHC